MEFEEDLPLRDRLNLETATIEWQTLAPFFARGELVSVAAELDLIDVAVAMAEDDKAQMQTWMSQGLVGLVSDAQASGWQAVNAALWAVVVRPWVLVQNRQPH